MALFRTSHNSVPPSERRFVKVLMVVIFFFAAANVSIIIPPGIADLGRWFSMMLAILLGFVWRNRYRSHRSNRRGVAVDILIWGLLIAFFLSAMFSVAEEKSLVYLAVCLLQVILFTFMSRGLSLESWRLVFNSLFALCIVVSFMGLSGYVGNPDKYIVQNRLAGLGNSNSVGLISMVGVVVSFVGFLFADMQDKSNWKLRKIFYFVGGISCLISLILTGSRSSLGGMLSGILVVFFLSGKAPRLMPMLLALIPLISLFDFTTLENKIAPAYSRGAEGDLLYTRGYLWNEAISLFNEDPWLGKGYAVHYADGYIIDGSGYHGLLASVGIIGTMMFIIVTAWILMRLFQRGMTLPKNFSENRELLAFGGGCFVAALVHGVGEPWIVGPGAMMHMFFWLSTGACIAGITIQQVTRANS